MASEPTLFYLAVLSGPRLPLETVHAHCADKSQRAYEAALASIFQTPGFHSLLAAGRSRLEVAIEPCGLPQTCWIELEYSGGGAAVDWAYVGVARRGAPARALFSSNPDSLLSELRRACDGALQGSDGSDRRGEVRALQRALRSALKPLVERFNAGGGGDKLRAAQESVRAAQSAALATLARATERDGLLEEIQVKTKRLEHTAEGFSSSAASLKRQACCRLYGLYFWIALALLAVVGVALLVTKYVYKMW